MKNTKRGGGERAGSVRNQSGAVISLKIDCHTCNVFQVSRTVTRQKPVIDTHETEKGIKVHHIRNHQFQNKTVRDERKKGTTG